MSSYLTEEEQVKINAFLNEVMEANPTYGELMDTLITTDRLNVREKVIAGFVAGETTKKMTMREKILEVLD